MTQHRGDWPALVSEALGVGSFAVELAALSESELPGLLGFLAAHRALPFRYVAVHAPVKERRVSEEALVERLATLPSSVSVIVVHPDALEDPTRYRPLGRHLVLENMDARKACGQAPDDLAQLFALLPEAGLCFDVAHAASVDPSLSLGGELLDRFWERLRQVHVSSLDDELHHVPLRPQDEQLFAPILERCRDVPWILEAPLPS